MVNKNKNGLHLPSFMSVNPSTGSITSRYMVFRHRDPRVAGEFLLHSTGAESAYTVPAAIDGLPDQTFLRFRGSRSFKDGNGKTVTHWPISAMTAVTSGPLAFEGVQRNAFGEMVDRERSKARKRAHGASVAGSLWTPERDRVTDARGMSPAVYQCANAESAALLAYGLNAGVFDVNTAPDVASMDARSAVAALESLRITLAGEPEPEEAEPEEAAI